MLTEVVLAAKDIYYMDLSLCSTPQLKEDPG